MRERRACFPASGDPSASEYEPSARAESPFRAVRLGIPLGLRACARGSSFPCCAPGSSIEIDIARPCRVPWPSLWMAMTGRRESLICPTIVAMQSHDHGVRTCVLRATDLSSGQCSWRWEDTDLQGKVSGTRRTGGRAASGTPPHAPARVGALADCDYPTVVIAWRGRIQRERAV